MKAAAVAEAPATSPSRRRRARARRALCALRRAASPASAAGSASSGAIADEWGPRLDAMRVAGRTEAGQQLEDQLRASITAQFAVIMTALDERFELQLADCRGVFADTVALVEATFGGIEARVARMPAIPAFPLPAAAPRDACETLEDRVRRFELVAERDALDVWLAESADAAAGLSQRLGVVEPVEFAKAIAEGEAAGPVDSELFSAKAALA